jgi:DNA-directed RNA polymerase specialized sigma24 family protein
MLKTIVKTAITAMSVGVPTATVTLVRLEPADRALLAMRYLAGLSAEEIGVATGLTGSGVRTRLSRLIARLREDLDHD